MHRGVRHTRRYIEIIRILIRNGFGDILTRSGLEKAIAFGKSGKIPEPDASVKNLTNWERIRRIFEQLGPAYIKFGQLLCLRGDLIPFDLVAELEKLNDNVEPFPVQTARAILEQELEGEIDTIFTSFDDVPIAAGSVAQVHKAVLLSGETVAVKIQRPGVLKQVRTDIEIMQYLFETICRKMPELRIYNLTRILDEFSNTIEEELDFLHEASNMEFFLGLYGTMEELYVPRCFRRYCSKKVITMEYVEGVKISETEKLYSGNYDLKLLARRGIDMMLKQVFGNGYFHADPHAGNLLVLKDNRLCLLDYGMMARITPSTSRLINSLLIGAVLKDSEYILKHVLRICQAKSDVNRKKLEADIADILNQVFSTSQEFINVTDLIQKCIRLFPEHNLVLPADLYLLGRMLILMQLNGGNRLDPDFNIAEHLEPFVKKNIQERFRISRLTKDAAAALEELTEFSKHAPFDIGEILEQTKQGELGFKLTLQGMKETRNAIERSANRLSIALVIASILLGSSGLMGPDCTQRVFGLPSACFLGFILAGVFGLILLISIIRHGKM